MRADVDSGIYVDPDRIHTVEHHGPQFDVRGFATLPAGPQGHPVLLQAGDSAEGRAFGARHADALFTLHSALEDGQRYYADVKGRAASYGRDPNQLKVFPAATFVLGRHRRTRRATRRGTSGYQQVSGPTAIAMLEQVWQRDLSAYDPDGPLPDVDPVDDPTITQGRVRHGDPGPWPPRGASAPRPRTCRSASWSSPSPAGSSSSARRADRRRDRPHVQADACDGFILVPHLTPHGLDEFVDRVVPLLQERGAFAPTTPGRRCATISAYRLNRSCQSRRRGCVVPISQTTVGWLLIAAAGLTFLAGLALRSFMVRRRETKAVRRIVRTFRKTGVARVLFGRFSDDVLDDGELDSMILMPTFVLGCGLCLTAIFLLGYEALT